MLKKLLLFLCLLPFFNGHALDSLSIKKRSIAILDLTSRNYEINDGELYSAKHIFDVAGLSYIVTTNVNTAIQYGTVITSSRLQDTTSFTTAEKDSLFSFVNKGGTLITPIVTAAFFRPLFGISSHTTASNRHRVIFDTSLGDQSMRWLNDTMEQTISIGKLSISSVITTRNYALTSSLALAHYEDLSPAITRNNYGSGTAYALGFSFKSLVLLNQVNKDYDAQRLYSNGFEPTTDAFILFIKGICTKHNSYSVWKHTSPYETRSSLMVTHDVDATTAFDSMSYYADYESSIGLSSTYLITTHYINDGALSDFYNPGSIPKVQYLQSKGHVIASHSVGHFVDFDIDTIVPLGVLGNTPSTYLPYSSGTIGSTVGATVIGEVEVSKNLLEADLGATIRTFRAGYLCFNPKLVNGLDTTGYEYNSTFAAGDVLTTFPYRNHKDRNSAGALTNVWEFPVNISDVFSTDPISITNYSAKQAIWLDVLNRNRDNYAPVVLLIHPNRIFKLWAEQDLLSQIPPDVFTSSLETFADYWRGRDSIRFSSEISNDTLTITIPSSQLPLNNMISFIVDNGQDLEYVKAQDENGYPVSLLQSNWDDNALILHLGYYSPLSASASGEEKLKARCYPNPMRSSSTLEISAKTNSLISIGLYNAMGQKMLSFACEKTMSGLYRYTIERNGLPAGTYFVIIHSGESIITQKIVMMQE